MSVFVSPDHKQQASQVYEANSPRSGKREGIHSKILDKCLTAVYSIATLSQHSPGSAHSLFSNRRSNHSVPETENC